MARFRLNHAASGGRDVVSDGRLKAWIRCALVVLVPAGLMACAPAVDPAAERPDSFPVQTETLPPYRIGPGDDLSVVMPYNPELNYEGPVGPDGRFTMPVAGTVLVAGKTVPEAENSIAKALADRHVVAAADPSVSIRHYTQQVYVGGEVKLPGAVALQSKMNPLQAITVAGGMLDTARSNQVVLIRQGPDGRPIIRSLDMDSFVHKGDPSQNIALEPRDIVFVPKSSIAEVDQWVDQYINKVLPFNRNVGYTYSNNISNTTP
jgi:polysaccharide biosynthesis/export protein PslD